MSEVDQSVEIVVASLPGWLLEQGLRETWAVVGGAWMQFDDLVEVDDQGLVVAIGGRPLSRSKTYRVGTTRRADFGSKEANLQGISWMLVVFRRSSMGLGSENL